MQYYQRVSCALKNNTTPKHTTCQSNVFDEPARKGLPSRENIRKDVFFYFTILKADLCKNKAYTNSIYFSCQHKQHSDCSQPDCYHRNQNIIDPA